MAAHTFLEGRTWPMGHTLASPVTDMHFSTHKGTQKSTSGKTMVHNRFCISDTPSQYEGALKSSWPKNEKTNL